MSCDIFSYTVPFLQVNIINYGIIKDNKLWRLEAKMTTEDKTVIFPVRIKSVKPSVFLQHVYTSYYNWED